MIFRRSKGFTLVELIVVIIVLGILVSIVALYFNSTQIKARDTKRTNDMRALMSGMQKYYAKNGQYPFSCDVVPTSTCASLNGSYQSTTGGPPTDSISSSTTLSQLQTLLPGLGTSFGDPARGTAGVIDSDNTFTPSLIAKNSYFFMSMDLLNFSGSTQLATNDQGTSSITCKWNTVNTDKNGITRNGASHYYVVGYFSESQNKWVFYKGPYDNTLNNTQWNYDNNAACVPTTA